MRKFLLTTGLVIPLGFGAALAQDTTAPAAEEPAVVTDDAAMTPAVDLGDKIVQQQAMNELRLEWITDAIVTAPDGTRIGDITDLIVDGDTGEMIAATIGVGGFLGIGQKQIAVPWESLTVNYDAQEVTSNLTKEEADAAPEYVFRDRAAPPAETATGTDAPAAMPPATAPTDGVVAPADPAVDPAMDPAAAPVDTMPAETMPADDMPEPTDPAAMEDAPADAAPASN